MYESLKPKEFYSQARKALAPMLGQAMLDGKPDPAGDPACATAGYFTRAGLLIQVEFVTFPNPGSGAAALTEWLSRKKCGTMHYDVSGQQVYTDKLNPEG
jgi:hypothetical protein